MSYSHQRRPGFDPHPQARPVQLGVSFTTQNDIAQTDHRPHFIEHIRRELVNQIMDTIANDCVEVIPGVYTTEYRLKLWVLTPDQLGRLVQDKADQLSRGFPFTYEEESPF